MDTLKIKEKGYDKLLEHIFQKDGKYANLYYPDNNENVADGHFRYIEEIEKGALMFLGLNPSRREIKDLPNYYTLDQTGDNGYAKYWNIFSIITENVNSNNEFGSPANLRWTHLDILGVIETKQEIVRKLLNQALGAEFIYEQVKISKQIIEESEPKILVVANTFARELTGKMKYYDKKLNKYNLEWMNFDFDFDKELGTYGIASGKLMGTPVFFTSMLNGQRALDNGSRDRLIWQIKRVAEIIKK